jgi:hypothetical protein
MQPGGSSLAAGLARGGNQLPRVALSLTTRPRRRAPALPPPGEVQTLLASGEPLPPEVAAVVEKRWGAEGPGFGARRGASCLWPRG